MDQDIFAAFDECFDPLPIFQTSYTSSQSQSQTNPQSHLQPLKEHPQLEPETMQLECSTPQTGQESSQFASSYASLPLEVGPSSESCQVDINTSVNLPLTPTSSAPTTPHTSSYSLSSSMSYDLESGESSSYFDEAEQTSLADATPAIHQSVPEPDPPKSTSFLYTSATLGEEPSRMETSPSHTLDAQESSMNLDPNSSVTTCSQNVHSEPTSPSSLPKNQNVFATTMEGDSSSSSSQNIRACPKISARQADQLDDYIVKHAERSHKYTISCELPDIGHILQEEKEHHQMYSSSRRLIRLPFESVKNMYYALHLERYLYDETFSEGRSIAKLFSGLKVFVHRQTVLCLDQLMTADQTYSSMLKLPIDATKEAGLGRDVTNVFPSYSTTGQNQSKADASAFLETVHQFLDSLSAFLENSRLDELLDLPLFEQALEKSVTLSNLLGVSTASSIPSTSTSSPILSPMVRATSTPQLSTMASNLGNINEDHAIDISSPYQPVKSLTPTNGHKNSIASMNLALRMSGSHVATQVSDETCFNDASSPHKEVYAHSLPKTPFQILISQTIQLIVISALKIRCNAAVVSLCNEKDILIAKKRQKLVGLPQSFFGIQEKDADEFGWRCAMNYLSHIEMLVCPFEKLQCLLDTAQAIYRRSEVIHKNMIFMKKRDKLREYHLRGQTASSTSAKSTGSNSQKREYGSVVKLEDPEIFVDEDIPPLSADDFFPIFIYVVVNSEVRRLESMKLFISTLCDQQSLQGEGGYYLTVFEAAIEYIARFSMTEHKKREEAESRRREKLRAKKEANRMVEMQKDLENDFQSGSTADIGKVQIE